MPLLRSRLDPAMRYGSHAAGADSLKLELLRALDFKSTGCQTERDGLSLTCFQYSNSAR